MKIVLKNKVFKTDVARGLRQLIGLMFQKPRLLIFPIKGEKVDIHTFFCFPIDIYWIRNSKVVKKITAHPFWVYQGTFAEYILETPKGFLNAKLGDKIKIEK